MISVNGPSTTEKLFLATLTRAPRAAAQAVADEQDTGLGLGRVVRIERVEPGLRNWRFVFEVIARAQQHREAPVLFSPWHIGRDDLRAAAGAAAFADLEFDFTGLHRPGAQPLDGRRFVRNVDDGKAMIISAGSGNGPSVTVASPSCKRNRTAFALGCRLANSRLSSLGGRRPASERRSARRRIMYCIGAPEKFPTSPS
ncbi:hypothetical protein LP419_22110 [Massilia sp. H-1]|nr:hypothetical protein LP419_22110 [Massilia sp. H-1]